VRARGWRDGASDEEVAVMDTGAQDAALGALRARWGAVPSAPWRWDDQPEGVIRVWFPEPHDLTIGCVLFPGDMETYEGPDLRLAEALSAAPADIALLLAALDAAAARQDALVALAHELVELEHGARAEQMQALNRLGILVTLDEHLARARAFSEQQHARIDALAELGQGEGEG